MKRSVFRFIANVPLGVILSIPMCIWIGFYVGMMSFFDYWRGLFHDSVYPQVPENEGVWDRHIRKLEEFEKEQSQQKQ